MNLHEAYTNRMKQMLGEEYPAFLKSYDEPRHRGLRVNTLKISPEEFERIAPFPVERIPWISDGFFYPEDVRPAQHPYYAAGLYYLQEPSAMTPAEILPVKPGDRVLDLCAAPGGKATELAAKLAGEGLLVANDISNSRTKALLRNLEMFGVQNMMVTNEVPARLAEAFPCYFDCILVDAPCSGEGMFRKEPAVADAWSPERVRFFAAQQKEILSQAYRMLRPGGYLLYSTCTFAPEEDEQQVRGFLDTYTDMRIADTGLLPHKGVQATDRAAIRNSDSGKDAQLPNAADLPAACAESAAGFSPGRPEWLSICTGKPLPAEKSDEETDAALSGCVRIWPHRMRGEGHFLALMKKGVSAGGDGGRSGAESDSQAEDGKEGRYTTVSGAESGRYTAVSGAKSGRHTAVSEAKAGGPGKRNKAGKKRGPGQFGKNSTGGGTEGGNPIGREELSLLLPFISGLSGLRLFPDTRAKRGVPDMGTGIFRLEERGGRAYMVQDLPDSVRGLHFLRNGLYLGEWKKNRFEPSQPLAMAQNMLFSDADTAENTRAGKDADTAENTRAGKDADTVENTRAVNALPAFSAGAGDARIAAYLRGESILLTDEEARSLADGWVLVCADRFSLGWGRKTGQLIKNKYPASWR